MSKLFGILALVLGVWFAAEVATRGVEGAFGGAFATDGAEDVPDAEPRTVRSVPQRAGDAVERAHEEAAARRQRLME